MTDDRRPRPLNLDDPVEYLTPPDQALWALRFYGLEKTAPVPGGSSPLPEKVKRSQHSSAHRRKRAPR
jgi:hypothetical protein